MSDSVDDIGFFCLIAYMDMWKLQLQLVNLQFQLFILSL